jgi:DNA polymerase elongation subunit (family B)
MSETHAGPKILTLDIETAPATALVFGQRRQEISNIQVIKPDRILGIGAKWLHEDKVEWRSEYHHGRPVMVKWIRDIISEADIVVHFNGATFDMPWIRRTIAEDGLTPYSPVQEVDLLQVVRKQFRYTSNKLENMVRVFGAGLKMENGGFGLWRAIEVGDEDEQRRAWNVMRRYCKQDVAIEEALYLRLLPYIKTHPHVSLYGGDINSEEPTCTNCGSDNLRREGYAYTKVGKYQRYQCRKCGVWGREKRALAIVEGRSA